MLRYLTISLGIFKPDKNHQNPKEKNMEQEFKKNWGMERDTSCYFINENGEKDKLMTPRQLAKYLESSISALSQYRALGTGPEYFKIGKMVRYRKSDVNQWLEQQRIGKK